MKVEFVNLSNNNISPYFIKELSSFFKTLWNQEVAIETKQIYLSIWRSTTYNSPNEVAYSPEDQLFNLPEIKLGYYSHYAIVLADLNWTVQGINDSEALANINEGVINFELKNLSEWSGFLKSFFAKKSKQYTRIETDNYPILVKNDIGLDITLELESPEKEWESILSSLSKKVNDWNYKAENSENESQGLIHNLYEKDSKNGFLALNVDLGSSGPHGIQFLIEELKELKNNIKGVVIY